MASSDEQQFPLQERHRHFLSWPKPLFTEHRRQIRILILYTRVFFKSIKSAVCSKVKSTSDLKMTLPENPVEQLQEPCPSTPQKEYVHQDSILEYFADPFETLADEDLDGTEELLPGDIDDDWENLDFQDIIDDKLSAAEIREILKERFRNELKRIATPNRILLRDKIAYVLGSLDLLISAFWLGHSPATFYHLYTYKCLILFGLRWIIYRSQRMHYYLFDFCYLAQVLLLVQLWFYPTNITFIKIVFAFSHGPLLWSILAFRNSLVFHSLDKVTSLFLHWFPACVCWATRWHPSEELQRALESTTNSSDALSNSRSSFRDICFLPMLPYFIWAVLYYIKIFHISSAKIQKKNYETLFAYVTQQRGAYATVVLAAPRRFQPAVYMLLHVALTFTTMLFNVVWWENKILGAAFITACFSWSAWNGGNYYFDHFAHTYIARLGIPLRGGSKTASPSAAVVGNNEVKSKES